MPTPTVQPEPDTITTDVPSWSPASPAPSAWSRVVIYSVEPNVDGGQWPVKRAQGETVDVVAGVIVDGHDQRAVELLYRHEDDEEEKALRMPLRYNDEYVASFEAKELGRYTYRVRAWLDVFATWQDQFRRRVEGGEGDAVLETELAEGAALLEKAAKQAKGNDKKKLNAAVKSFKTGDAQAALDEETLALAQQYDPREGAIETKDYEVIVDPKVAAFGAWYEFFPRSTRDPGSESGAGSQHGTLDDAAERLPRIKELGFDIVYLPPVHPIGEAFRKGKDNAPEAQPGEPGSPWAIGGKNGDGTLGGHKAVHPDLGGIDAFDRFVKKADGLGLKVALDIAFQTSPDHPYVKEHPEWFRHRADGTIRYAENPPKKYQDVYPFDFESDQWRSLWNELRSVFTFWIEHGVTVFRVDNPHTKPLAFWKWCIATLREEHPELIFLAEAFTKPKTMHLLAKLGFNNSYTYFTWRNTKEELQSYAEELFQTDVAEFYRPNFWPNTPDILHDYLARGGRPAHVVRFVLASTLSSVYGVYGPPYEHVDNRQHPDREEYAHNEKYEVRTWNWDDPHSLQGLMKRVNRIRRDHPALQQMRQIEFHETANDDIIAYTKEAGDDLILVVANLDPHSAQEGWVSLPLADLGLPEHDTYEMEDLLGGERYQWFGPHNYVRLDPHVLPAHILHVKGPRVKREA